MTDSPSTEKKDFMGPPRPEHEVTNDTSGKKPQEMTTAPEAPATPDLSPSANAVPTSKGSGRSGSSPPPQSPSDALRAQERHPKSAPGAGSSKLAVGISVIALLLAVGVGYWLWHALQSLAGEQSSRVQAWESALQQQESQIQTLQATVEQVNRTGEKLQQEIRQEITTTRTDVQQLLTEFDQRQQQHLERLDDRLDAQQQRLLRLSTTDREDWLLSEASHLLRFANQRILIERSPSNAMALLESADELLQQAMGGSGDAELFAIRKTIRSEITALKLVKSPDKAGNYARLAGLVEHLDGLPARGGLPLGQPFSETSVETESAEASNWRAKLWGEIKSLAGVFDDYVRVQDADTPTELLTDQAALQLVRMNLHLLVDQAQAALIREEEALYQDSLTKIRDFLLQYYVASSERDALEKMIDELSQVSVSPQMPDVSGSSRRLQAYVEEMHRLRSGDDT